MWDPLPAWPYESKASFDSVAPNYRIPLPPQPHCIPKTDQRLSFTPFVTSTYSSVSDPLRRPSQHDNEVEREGLVFDQQPFILQFDIGTCCTRRCAGHGQRAFVAQVCRSLSGSAVQLRNLPLLRAGRVRSLNPTITSMSGRGKGAKVPI